MDSSSAFTYCFVSASMVAEAFGASSKDHVANEVSVAAIAPVLLISLAVCILAVAAFSIRALRQAPSTPATPANARSTTSTTVDVNALGPPSFTLNLDDDNVLDFDDDEEEEDDEAREEMETRRIGNLAQVMKSGRFFRNGVREELPYSPRHCRRSAASSVEGR